MDLVTASEANKNQLSSIQYGSNNQKKLKLDPCQLTKVKVANNSQICSEIPTIQVDHVQKIKEKDPKKVLKSKSR